MTCSNNKTMMMRKFDLPELSPSDPDQVHQYWYNIIQVLCITRHALVATLSVPLYHSIRNSYSIWLSQQVNYSVAYIFFWFYVFVPRSPPCVISVFYTFACCLQIPVSLGQNLAKNKFCIRQTSPITSQGEGPVLCSPSVMVIIIQVSSPFS